MKQCFRSLLVLLFICVGLQASTVWNFNFGDDDPGLPGLLTTDNRAGDHWQTLPDMVWTPLVTDLGVTGGGEAFLNASTALRYEAPGASVFYDDGFQGQVLLSLRGLTVGEQYRVAFYLAPDADGTTHAIDLSYSWGGHSQSLLIDTASYSLATASIGSSVFLTPVETVPSNGRLVFLIADNPDVRIGAIQLEWMNGTILPDNGIPSVPEPACAAELAAASVLAFFVLRRRRSS